MKRFVQAYVTIIAILIVIANLGLVILYGRQFVFRAEVEEACTGPVCRADALATDLVVMNSVLVGLFLVLWFVFYRLYHLHRAGE